MNARPAVVALLTLAALVAQDPPPAVGGAVPRPPGAEPEPPPPSPDDVTSEDARREHDFAAAALADDRRRDSPGAPRWRCELAFGGGDFEHETVGAPTLQDETGGGYFRLGFEYLGPEDFGGGLRLEGTASDDDLFLATAGSPAEIGDGELFLHGTGLFGDDAVRVPLRFGLSFRGYTIDDPTGADLTWASVGPRVELEPDFRLLGNEAVRWSLYGRLSGFAGFTAAESDPATEDWTTTMVGVDVGVGTRLAFEHVQLGIGYLVRSHHAAESDTVNSTFLREFDAEMRGLELSFAVLF